MSDSIKKHTFGIITVLNIIFLSLPLGIHFPGSTPGGKPPPQLVTDESAAPFRWPTRLQTTHAAPIKQIAKTEPQDSAFDGSVSINNSLETKALVKFANQSTKQRFLANNGLSESDLEFFATINTYGVAKSPEELNPSGAEVQTPIQYKVTALGDDPLASEQWALDASSFPDAWDTSTGNGVTVAVIDTGFALSHEDLSGVFTAARYDFANGDSNPSAGQTSPGSSSAFHGTFVAGIIAAASGNGKGVTGLAPNARIMPVQALSDSGSGYTQDVAQAVHFAADNGAKVINLSLGSSQPDSILQDEIDYAIGLGVTVVAAAGNDGCNCLLYPARYPEVIAVGATAESGVKASFSSYGANLDLVAPGAGICSTSWTQSQTTTAYACGNGTSFATPAVSAAAALLKSANSSLTPAKIDEYLKRSANKLTPMSGSPQTSTYGYGQLNAYLTVLMPTLIAESQPSNTLLTSKPRQATLCKSTPGTSCSLTVQDPAGNNITLTAGATDSFGSAVLLWNLGAASLSP